MFLLQHCPDVPDLHISSEEEYRLYTELRRMANDASINESDVEAGFKYNDRVVMMEKGNILVTEEGKVIGKISVETFMRKPRKSLELINLKQKY